jgi:crotonobetainyl-CoA:carnitine CoA-transferase CaiB-like acyl-CoA transferase
VIGRSDLLDDPRFTTNAGRRRNIEALISELESSFAAKPAAEWITELRAAGVPVGEINSIAEAFDLAGRLEIDAVAEDASGFKGVRSPISFGEPSPGLTPPPALDADGPEIRRTLESGGRPV